MHSWSVGRCLGLGIGGILGVWPWFHPTIQLDRPMLLVLLLPGEWLQFEKKTNYYLEILLPDREMWLGWLMKAKGWWNQPRGGCLPASGVFLLDWSQQERGVAMKSSGLRCLAGQVIQIVHGRQAEGCLSEIYRICSWASSETVHVSMETLPWISWELEVNVAWWKQKEIIPDSESWKDLDTCWVSRIIPEHLMMYEGVCYESLLLLQIGVQGHLNYKARIWSAFR